MNIYIYIYMCFWSGDIEVSICIYIYIYMCFMVLEFLSDHIEVYMYICIDACVVTAWVFGVMTSMCLYVCIYRFMC